MNLPTQESYSMRTLFSFLLVVLTTLGLSAFSAVQPAADNEATGSMPGMDHGSMNMNNEMPFDAMFIDSMIEHHQGAIDMAEMAIDQAEHEELRTMAQDIVAAQTTEIEQMQSWRSEWYPDLDATDGMDMAMGDMTISEDASIPFDQRFIQAMISHHAGAIEMAEMALEQAEHEEIRTLADAIIAAQNAEIEQMQAWLEAWYGDTAVSSSTLSPYAAQ